MNREISIDKFNPVVLEFCSKLIGQDSYQDFLLVDSFEIHHPSGIFYDAEMGVFGSIVSDEGDKHVYEITESEKKYLDLHTDTWLVLFEDKRPDMLAERIKTFTYEDIDGEEVEEEI